MSDEWKASATADDDGKSWKLLEKTLLAGVQEQRRARRWGIFFKLLTFIYLFGALALVLPALDLKSASTATEHTALIEIRGMIADREEASADKVARREVCDTKWSGAEHNQTEDCLWHDCSA